MRHTERLNSEAAVTAAKTDEWLLPAEAGTLEAEGMERTWRFSQVYTLACLASHQLCSQGLPNAILCALECHKLYEASTQQCHSPYDAVIGHEKFTLLQAIQGQQP